MTPPHTRRSERVSPDQAKKRSDSRTPRNRHVAVRGAAAAALAERKDASIAPVQTRADVERLMGQLREANERLIVAAVHAQDLSDEAHVETAQARTELDDLIRQLRDANERLAGATMRAHTMAEEALQREAAYRRLSGRLLQLQDDERRRFAADLHDSMGQRLAALVMNLDLLEGAEEALDARSRQVLLESRSLAEQCAQEVRTLAYLLHPPLFEEIGLVSAVRWYVTGFAKRSGIHVAMSLDEIGRLPRPTEMALFRVVQESLTNVHRHASTSTASVRLTSTANDVVLDIQDRGHGLRGDLRKQNDAPVPDTLGVGIQGMRERIRQLAGTFDVEFTDKGTTVRVSVPLGKATEERDGKRSD
jgi:signal transduction histidine kinase